MEFFSTRRLAALACVFTLAACVAAQSTSGEEVASYSVGSWAQELGNYRARIKVVGKADAVWAHLPWRRHDATPQAKAVIVRDSVTGKQLSNVVIVQISDECGDLVFQPETAPGDYEIYYMPYSANQINAGYAVTYTPPQSKADPAWVAQNQLSPDRQADGKWKSLPKAALIDLQARSEFDRVDPMEVIATRDETDALIKQFKTQSYLLFPEDRRFPTRMIDFIPVRWAQKGPSTDFHGKADRDEFYVFQIGVFAARQAISNVTVLTSGFKSPNGDEIPSSEIHSFDTAGTDWAGRKFTKTFAVESGKVRPLWFGVQIPRDAKAGKYEGIVRLKPDSSAEARINIAIDVSDKALDDHGDGDLWRLARLRWLDSSTGIDDGITAPYTPVQVQGERVKVLGREIKFGVSGLPSSITTGGREILAKPIEFVAEAANGPILWKDATSKVVASSDANVARESECAGGDLRLKCSTNTAYDGYTNVTLEVTATKAVDLQNMRLLIPVKKEIAGYMMGLGRKGGYRPVEWKWTWEITRANNAVWLGDVDAGLQCKLKNTNNLWEGTDLKTTGIPESWSNNGQGGCTVTENGDVVLVNAYSGKRHLQASEHVEFNFGLLVTPVKPLNPRHWNQRYFQFYKQVVPAASIAGQGANIINIHQGNELNPYINYPFRAVDKLRDYVKQAHDAGCRAKIYYTVHELSNFCTELWPVRSLGDEIYTDGPGGGSAWLREHFVGHYNSAWHEAYPNGDVDAAIQIAGLSRWHNYYLESLSWLIKNVGIDGLYLDGVGYNRDIMQRVRKVMDHAHPGCLIDFHSGNNYVFNDMRVSCANMYMEHFPYIDSLWFGELFDANESPDYWLIEMSGLPFGLYSEMLEGGGNPWRGMLYGMTNRLGWGGDPRSIWKLWDDFGIQDAKMIGYWNSSCPVRTSNKNVLATAYSKQGKTLIAIASWAKEPTKVRLNIDWKALGLDSTQANLRAPALEGLQSARDFQYADDISVEPGKGWMLLLDEKR